MQIIDFSALFKKSVRLLPLFAFIFSGQLQAADGAGDAYVMVDLGRKYYDFKLRENNGIDKDEYGAFTSHITISPTLRFRSEPNEVGTGFLLLAGVSYSHFSTSDITVDITEWNLGLGFTAHMTEWSHFDLQVNGGYGLTVIELPGDWQTINGEKKENGYNLSGQITAGVTIEIDRVILLGQVGLLVKQLNIEDEDLKRSATYSIYGVVAAFGVGLTF